MTKITYEKILEKHQCLPKRRCFAIDSGLQKAKANGSKSFSVPFPESIQKIFEAQTGLNLFSSKAYNNSYRVINDADELKTIENWEAKQGTRIFLRDCLDLSIALDMNFTGATDNDTRTYIGNLEYCGKNHHDQNSIDELTRLVTATISDLPFYKDADYICAVPPNPNKEFDLPSKVVSLVSKNVNKSNITAQFIFSGQKQSVKESTYENKWKAWEDAQISFNNAGYIDITDKTIILLDDKYQSGITIQYIAMKLLEAGANKIYGLSFVKTLRDTDNT